MFVSGNEGAWGVGCGTRLKSGQGQGYLGKSGRGSGNSADLRQWETWLPAGLFFGVTTNPVLLRDAGQSCSCDNLELLVRREVDLNVREVQMQSWGVSVDAMVRTGRLLADMDSCVVVKVPATRNGTAAASRLLAHGVRITMTCVFAVHQALTAVALGPITSPLTLGA